MTEQKELHLLGLSFRNAPAAVREGLSFNRTEAAALLRAAAADSPGLEALVLSTCNRTEFYLFTPPGSGAAENWLQRLRRLRPDALVLHSECQFYEQTGAEAACHLFRVACGLDSAVLGDLQILGQVKESGAVAAESGSLGAFLNCLVRQALQTGKRARSETRISRGAASVGSALVRMLLARHAETPRGETTRVVILGAGKIARDIGRHAAKQKLGALTFLNRTNEKATELARLCGGASLPWSKLHRALLEADVVIAATAAPQPVLTRSVLDAAAAARPDRSLLVVDTGLPRNVEPGSKVEVLDIDAIREQQEEILTQRRAAVPAVERIVADEVRTWENWLSRRPLENTIKLLYQNAAMHSHELAQALSGLDSLSPERTEEVLYRSVKKFLHGHVRRLRADYLSLG